MIPNPADEARGMCDRGKGLAKRRAKQREIDARREPRVMAVRYGDDGAEVLVHAGDREDRGAPRALGKKP